jgi:hypothetical protein
MVHMHQHPSFRFPFHSSLQNKLGITSIPVVNYYFDIIKTAIETIYTIELKPSLWKNHNMAFCLTHDIDRIHSGWLEEGFSALKQGRPLSTLRLIKERIIYRDIWNNLTEILDIEQKHGVCSSYFFLPRKGKSHFSKPAEYDISDIDKKWSNSDYDISASPFPEIFHAINQNNSEVGLHGSIGTHLDLDRLKMDMQNIPVQLNGIRFHLLNFHIKKTWDILEKSGLKYDSTLGFAEAPGFRNGIAFPFYPFNHKQLSPYRILEIPMIIMDGTFTTYLHESAVEAWPQIQKLIDEVERFNGCLTVLWHNHFFSEFKFKGWGNLYEKIIAEGINRNAFLGSGEQIQKMCHQCWNE